MRLFTLIFLAMTSFAQNPVKFDVDVTQNGTAMLTINANPKDFTQWGDLHVFQNGKDIVIASPTTSGEWNIKPNLSRTTMVYALEQLIKALRQTNQFSLDRQKEDRKNMKQCLEDLTLSQLKLATGHK